MKNIKIDIKQGENGYVLTMRAGANNPNEEGRREPILRNRVYKTQEFNIMMDDIKEVLLAQVGP